MSKFKFCFFVWVFLFISLSNFSYSQSLPKTFPERYGELFVDVQMQPVYSDSKKFTDMLPVFSDEIILDSYYEKRQQSNFDLKSFVEHSFIEAKSNQTNFHTDKTSTVKKHIETLWDVLSREGANNQNKFSEKPYKDSNSSLIKLPYKYVVPGGRFNEVYYWDSYFTMLGLQVSNRNDLIRGMVDNFAYLIDEYGFIPNGNRKYYLSRSQPPFFSLMVSLLAEIDGEQTYIEYLPQLEKEYEFWMDGRENLDENLLEYRRVVLLPNGKILNRYWDDKASPRPEGYKEDVEIFEMSAKQLGRTAEEIYRDIKAACESGWDFSSRWFADGENLATIQTTQIIPVDLNSLLWNLENTIAKAHRLNSNYGQYRKYQQRSYERLASMNQYLWDSKDGYFLDYNFVQNQKIKHGKSLAGVYPLFFMMATEDQAKSIKEQIQNKFLQNNGLLTTLNETEEQWDGSKGWAPLHWITIKGLQNYGYENFANEVSSRWINTNLSVFCESGKLVEKYNVIENIGGEGGEYPLQDGFGWTNGVLLRLLNDYEKLGLQCN